MKKRTIIVLLLIFLFLSCSFTVKHSYQKTLLPKPLQKMHIGMEKADFTKIKSLDEMEKYDSFEFRDSYVETLKPGDIKNVTYYFTKKDPQILYEFIVEYQPDIDVPALANEMYGKPNNDEEWIFDSQEGFDIMVWIYEQKVIIAGKLPGTEWE